MDLLVVFELFKIGVFCILSPFVVIAFSEALDSWLKEK